MFLLFKFKFFFKLTNYNLCYQYILFTLYFISHPDCGVWRDWFGRKVFGEFYNLFVWVQIDRFQLSRTFQVYKTTFIVAIVYFKAKSKYGCHQWFFTGIVRLEIRPMYDCGVDLNKFDFFFIHSLTFSKYRGTKKKKKNCNWIR